MDKHDIHILYEQLSGKYNLLLTTTMALDEGFTIDVPVLCGQTPKGKFFLYKEYDDSSEFVFSVDYTDKSSTHWHPYSIEIALDDIIRFMEDI